MLNHIWFCWFQGFFETSDKFPPYVYSGVASLGDLDKPAMLGLTIREVCEKLTSLCLQRYNRDEASCSFFFFFVLVFWLFRFLVLL